MLGLAILGLALFVGSVLIAQWYVQADPRAVARLIRWGSVVLALGLLAGIAVARAWNWIPAIAIALLPWLINFRQLRGLAGSRRRPSTGQTSSVRTRYFEVTLDHDTGDMDGIVLEGPDAGSRFTDLSLEALLDLLQVCAEEDEHAASVLAAYLDRTHPGWRESAGAEEPPRDQSSRGSGPRMSAEEAREILGVDEGASEDEIKAAHRRLMKRYHPDHGGSSYLASKINEAKDRLLGS